MPVSEVGQAGRQPHATAGPFHPMAFRGSASGTNALAAKGVPPSLP